ncbi:MAG: cyclodeaminase/cyclohydrolase family protein [Clostridia bacterium]|nr:cyclodeaminase/cyclohydrolase family protein [Clostridia bacterium]
MQINEFIDQLSSKSPTPGGGGASALVGAIGVSLCSMVGNLTSGKKKYIKYQKDIDIVLSRAGKSIGRLLDLMQKDEEVFEPLAVAYGIPKDSPDRDRILEQALVDAASVPLNILREISDVIEIVELLAVGGSKLAISDIGVAASALSCAMEGAAMNVYINTKLMKNREYADTVNNEADKILSDGVKRCDMIYQKIRDELR